MSQINPLLLAQLFLGKMSEGADMARQFRQEKHQAAQDAQQQENFNTEQTFRQDESKRVQANADRSFAADREDSAFNKSQTELNNKFRELTDSRDFAASQEERAWNRNRLQNIDNAQTDERAWRKNFSLAELGEYQGTDPALASFSNRSRQRMGVSDANAGLQLLETYRSQMRGASDADVASAISRLAVDGPAKQAALETLSRSGASPEFDVGAITSVYGERLPANANESLRSYMSMLPQNMDPYQKMQAVEQRAHQMYQLAEQEKSEKISHIYNKLEEVRREKSDLRKILSNPESTAEAQAEARVALEDLSTYEKELRLTEKELVLGKSKNPFSAEPASGQVGPPSSPTQAAPETAPSSDRDATLETLRIQMGPKADAVMPFIGRATASFMRQNGVRPQSPQDYQTIIDRAIEMANSESPLDPNTIPRGPLAH